MVRFGLVLILLSLILPDRVLAIEYATARSAAVSRCEAIDRAAYQTGLYGNPDGYRSFYVRSQCFQTAAVEFRDESLCAGVRQRRSIFASSWGYSSSRCRTLVTEGIAKDRSELEEIKRQYSQNAVRLRSFRIERNGNGRDFDIIPVFSGSYARSYLLTFDIPGAGSTGAPILLHSSGYHIDSSSNLNIYVRQAEIRERFPGFTLNRPYQVRATAILDVGMGGQGGYWSDAFIERVFPARDRSQSITLQTTF